MSRVTVSAIPRVPTVSSSHFVASLGLLLGYWEGGLRNHEVFSLPQSSLSLGSRLSELIWTWVVKFNDSSHELILPTLIILQSIF